MLVSQQWEAPVKGGREGVLWERETSPKQTKQTHIYAASPSRGVSVRHDQAYSRLSVRKPHANTFVMCRHAKPRPVEEELPAGLL